MVQLLSKVDGYAFDFEAIKADVLSILDEYPGVPQIGLTHSANPVSDVDKIVESTGSIIDKVTGQRRFSETDFTEFNDKYKSTSLYEMYKAIPNIGRFRIMTMLGPKCYTLHKDLTMRYHFVIETNPDCLFLFPDQKEYIHVPADGNLYLLNTKKRHTFLNGSTQRRIHLVLDDITPLKK